MAALRTISGAIVAPASLKLRIACRGAYAAEADFRGDCCPGLIEAQPHLPGVIAPGAISGAIVAPASLKRQLRWTFVWGGVDFRGDCCPGLIEAVDEDGKSRLRFYAFPGRLLPRPH